MNLKSFAMGALACAILVGVYHLQHVAAELSDDSGGAKYVGKIDIKDSPYYAHPDVYNLQPNANLLILPHFKTKQQIKNYTCGPCAAGMVVENLAGRDLHSEAEIAKIMGTSTTKGTDTNGMVKYFKHIGWQVESSEEKGSPKSYEEFLKFVVKYLKAGTPVIVENIDWGGHWRVIIGYDTMGTEYTGDDVLLLADPLDITDHLQDGYNVVPAQRFYSMWFDDHLFAEGHKMKLWLAARPK